MIYFGTDGIRGKPNKSLTIEFVMALGRALKCLNNHEVLLGMDTRISKDMLASAITAGCLSVGMNVYILGVLPTPALIYLSKEKKMIGVMITASHNPYTDNGIKVINQGKKLTKKEEQKIEQFIEKKEYLFNIPGQCFMDGSILKSYVKFLESKVIKTNLKIAIDCANGATFRIAPEIFGKATDHLVVVAAQPNGININNKCGSTHLELLKNTVIENGCDIGFAFDGDGDRVLCIDNKGDIVDGDHIIYLIASYLHNKNKLKDNQIVLTIMSNLGVIKSLESRGISTIETSVGDRYILETLEKNNLSLGGENSGHIIVPSLFPSGDGMLIALFILQILNEYKISLREWMKDIESYENCHINVSVQNKTKIINNKELFERMDEIKKELEGDCRIIVRASGTEELVRIMVMAKNKTLVYTYATELQSLVKKLDKL